MLIDFEKIFSFVTVANMLYVEHPAFVGFSYSNRGGDYYYTHAMISKANLQAVLVLTFIFLLFYLQLWGV